MLSEKESDWLGRSRGDTGKQDAEVSIRCRGGRSRRALVGGAPCLSLVVAVQRGGDKPRGAGGEKGRGL